MDACSTIVMILMILFLMYRIFFLSESDLINEKTNAVKICFDKTTIIREGYRNVNPKYYHNKYDSLVSFENVIDDIDIAQLLALSDCIKTYIPPRYEFRPFGDNLYGSGNYVTFLTGLMPILIPSLTDYIVSIAMEAAEAANWRPHVSHLSIRCIETLTYNPGGWLSFHTDTNSTYTLVLSFSNGTDYKGGEFMIRGHDDKLQNHTSPKFGGVLFDSNKYHAVSPIQEGQRTVFVVELWPFLIDDLTIFRPNEDNTIKRVIPKLLEVPKQNYCPLK